MPAVLTLTTMVVPQVRSRRKMSAEAFLSPTTRLLAKEVKATKRPSGLTAAPPESELPTVPVVLTLTSSTTSVVSPMVMVKSRFAAAPGLSVTRTVKVKVPRVVGVPTMTPLSFLSASPGGRLEPLPSCHL